MSSQNEHPSQSGQYCHICSFKQPYPSKNGAVYHKHLSTVATRKKLGTYGSDQPINCETCKMLHIVKSKWRMKLILSDYVLYNYINKVSSSGEQYVGDSIHIEHICIIGIIEDLLAAFRIEVELGEINQPLDVVIICGYADLILGHSKEHILEGIRTLTDTVLTLGAMRNPKTPNSVAVATLMHPPLLSWFEHNGQEPFNYQNCKEKIDWLNDEINYLNLVNNCPYYPGFHTYGTRTCSIEIEDHHQNIIKTNIISHRWEHWNENYKREKITLRTDRIFKIAIAINNYFHERTLPMGKPCG